MSAVAAPSNKRRFITEKKSIIIIDDVDCLVTFCATQTRIEDY